MQLRLQITLTSVEVFLILGFIVSGIPGVLFAVLAHLYDKDNLVLVPLGVLHSLYVRFLFTLDTQNSLNLQLKHDKMKQLAKTFQNRGPEMKSIKFVTASRDSIKLDLNT